MNGNNPESSHLHSWSEITSWVTRTQKVNTIGLYDLLLWNLTSTAFSPNHLSMRWLCDKSVSNIQSFWGAVNLSSIFRLFFHYYTYPLHVSAPTGHLQVEYIYWLIPKKLFLLQRIRCSCLSYQLYILYFFNKLVPYDAVNRNKVSICQLLLYFPSHSLHVSAPTGHLQVRYTIRYF
jgi:hypothetical protein